MIKIIIILVVEFCSFLASIKQERSLSRPILKFHLSFPKKYKAERHICCLYRHTVMVINKDEALRSLDIAKAAYQDGNIPKAIKFVKKSISLHQTPEAEKLLSLLSSQSQSSSNSSSSSSPKPSASSSSSSTSHTQPRNRRKPSSDSSATTSSRDHNQGRQTRDFTPEQAASVKEIKQRNASDYYAVLGLEKSASESEIKKAYRKLALQLHPDKNSAPGADEAFKAVSKAFAILGDEDKRRQYDQYGFDPDSRSAAGPSMSGFRSQRFHGEAFEGEIDPEELFRMFFGDLGGPGFRAQFHTPRTRTRFHHPRNRSHQQHHETTFNISPYIQLFPLFLLFAISILNTLFSPSYTLPDFSLSKSTYYSTSLQTRSHRIPYYVNPKSYSSFVASYNADSYMVELEDKVENTFFTRLSGKCRAEVDLKQRKLNQARGGWFFGQRDEQKWKEAMEMKLDSCDKLREYGFSVQY
ncbi:hypothetical protein BKA69DRAFT_1101501 [Paraphysoderma sedebokerense]|nr:hypothetical protein BKA69DRAFT_1101501 [Paraphysoderma sedebokerense]